MRVILSVIYEITAFLVHEPNTSRSTPRSPCAFDHFGTASSEKEETLGLSDLLLTTLSSWVGVELPRAMTILNGLPLATSLLLRLTEVIPPELLLFFCVTGMVFWLVFALLLIIGATCMSGMFIRVFCWPSNAFSRLLNRSNTPPPAPARAIRARTTEQVPRPLPPPPRLALSDEAQHLMEDVRALNPGPTPPDTARLRPRRNTKP